MKKLLFVFLLFGSSVMAQINGSFTFDGLNRSFLTYVPASYNPDQSVPLVFVLHAFTQNGTAIMNCSGFNTIADANNFIIVYPDGMNLTWNSGGASSVDDVGFINALLDSTIAHYNIDLSRVYSCGLSMGGFMSYTLVCQITDRFAAIAAVSGTMADATYTSCSPTRPIPVMHIHGTTDNVIPYTASAGNKGAEDVVNYFVTYNNCPTTPAFTNLPDIVTTDGCNVEKYEYGPGDRCSQVVFLKIINGGHQWPSALTLCGLGNTNLDFNASQEIWNFFQQFTADGACAGIDERRYSNIHISPNPTSGLVKIDGENLKDVTIVMYDLYGKAFLQQKATASICYINISNFANGIYFVKVGTRMIKLVKQ